MQAVLADMDGTLVDSEPLWFEVECEVVARLGGTWTRADQERLLGTSLEVAARHLLVHTGSRAAAADVERAGRWLMDGMVERLSANVPLMPGAKELMVEVAGAGIPMALVTSSRRELVEPVLEALGSDWFATTVAGDEVRHKKPHPEPYLTAAARLGADPRRCVALEDSPTGLASAEAAGCRTVAVPGVLDIPPAPRRIVVQSLRQVDLRFLASLVP